MQYYAYIGWDSREAIVYETCKKSLYKHGLPNWSQGECGRGVLPIPLIASSLRSAGLYTRPADPLSSTEFSFTRFLVPHLHRSRIDEPYVSKWALFCDSDIIFTRDAEELFKLADDKYAIMCVQHDYKPTHTTKMDGKAQSVYPRKNWSSVVLWNCTHPANDVVTPDLVNSETGQYLHRFSWLTDDLIGALPEEWNWLEGWSKKPDHGLPAAIHYTNGAPNFENCQNVDYAEEWNKIHAELCE